MKALIRPIALNETSYNVALLHKTLAILGLPVAKEEAAQHRAGQDTLAKVRSLQKQLNLDVDDSILVDETTVVAIAEVLDKRGLTAAPRSFTITGTAKLQGGSVRKQQRLL